MSNKCRAYSRATNGSEPPGFKVGFYAGYAARSKESAGSDHASFLISLHDQIGDDKWTSTFQSYNQILSAIREAIREHIAT